MNTFTATADGVTFTRTTAHTYTHAVVAAPAPGNRARHYDPANHGKPKFASFHKSLAAAEAKVRQVTKTIEPRFIVGGAYEVINVRIVEVAAL